VISHRNRSGNVRDSTGAARFLRDTIREIRKWEWFSGLLEVRTDAAFFFQREILEAYDRLRVEYATKVPMMP